MVIQEALNCGKITPEQAARLEEDVRGVDGPRSTYINTLGLRFAGHNIEEKFPCPQDRQKHMKPLYDSYRFIEPN